MRFYSSDPYPLMTAKMRRMSKRRQLIYLGKKLKRSLQQIADRKAADVR